MKEAILSLYLNDYCNLNCNYCNIQRKDKTVINEEQVKKFILDNKEDIDNSYINLLGGEPSIIYSNQFLMFLKDNFKEIIVTTNLKDKLSIENLANILGEKLILSVSYNEEIIDQLKENIEHFNKYINKFSIVITNDNVSNLFNIVHILSKFDKKILISPEIDKHLKGYKLNIGELKKQLTMIFDNHLETKLINYQKILNGRKADYELCKKTSLNISKNGKLSSCSYVSDVYVSNKIYTFGDIFSTKIKDIIIDYEETNKISFDGTNCSECKKCHNFKCTPRYQVSEDNKVQQQICEFNKTFYDFVNNYTYKPNLQSITIFMTEQCNMKCTYCFEKDFKNRLGKVSNKVIEKSLDLLFANDNGEEKKFTFFGGEPSLNVEGIRHALEYYIKLKNNGLKSTIYFDINTNLLVLTDELIELFKEIRTYAPFYISVSCDGFKELNDKQRIDLNGQGTYDRVINNAKKLRNAFDQNCKCTKVKICKHTVLNNQNIPFIEEICEETYRQRDIFDEFSINYITPGKGDHEIITMENLQLISDYYNKKILKFPDEKKEFIKKYLSLLNLDTVILNNYGFSICDVIDSTLSIRANGDIIPCHAFLDKIDEEYNKIKIDNILNVDVNNFGFSFNSQWHKLTNKNDKINSGDLIIKSELGYNCKDCMFKFLCHTCVANLKEINGNILIKSEEQCMRVLNQAEILLKIKEIQGVKELKELQLIEDELLANITEGITSVGELAVGNRHILMEILKDE